jgi:uncharacterized protein
MYLPDVNVWLALTFDSHIHHPAAKTWFDNLPESAACLFCRLTQQGFLRLATSPTVFGKHTLNLADAWQKYGLLLSDPRVGYAEEPAGLEPLWRGLTQSQSYSPKVWNDAYLVAFAQAATLHLVSFDQGLSQYPSVTTLP